MARFDWYSATLVNDLPPIQVVEALMSSLEGSHGFEQGKGVGGYAQQFSVCDSGGETLATVRAGGYNGNPHVIGTGENAPAVAQCLREFWPRAHRVARVDSCIDVLVDFAELEPRMVDFGKRWSLKGSTWGAHSPSDGSTCYLGATASPIRVRAYEKGKELVAKGLAADPGLEGLVRLEAQVRPIRDGRLIAAELTPEQVWGSSPWLRAYAQEFAGVEVARVELQARTLSSFDRRCDVLAAQWGAHLAAWAHSLGSWEALGAELGRRIHPPSVLH